MELRPAAPQAPGNGSVDWSIEGYVRRPVEAQPGTRWECQADNQWLYVIPPAGMRRGQGWKLHISGTVLSAEEILARALSVLVFAACAFKVTRDLAFLESLCATDAPRASAGKFITIYPADDEACGTLAAELDARLAGIHGPVVLSDLPYRPSTRPGPPRRPPSAARPAGRPMRANQRAGPASRPPGPANGRALLPAQRMVRAASAGGHRDHPVTGRALPA